MLSKSRFAFVLALVSCSLAPVTAAMAQSAYCSRLLSQISAAENSGGSRKYSAAAARQNNEIARTMSYARSIGCDNQKFLFFGKSAPAECGGIKAHIAQMQANAASLENAAVSGGGRKAALQAQYDSKCGGTQEAAVQPRRGLFDNLFSQEPRDTGLRDVPIDDPAQNDQSQRSHGGGRVAICVKKLDGAFFPVSYSARSSDLGELERLCQALCPAVEVKIYTWNSNQDLSEAMDMDDEAYSSLPNANKFRTKYVPEAACKPAGKSWAQVLGPAEEVLGEHSKSDILVTPARAAELSRVKDPTALASLAKKKKTAAADDAEVEAYTEALSKATASAGTPAGIGVGQPSSGPTIGVSQGELREEIGPDGIKRKVRIIGPTL